MAYKISEKMTFAEGMVGSRPSAALMTTLGIGAVVMSALCFTADALEVAGKLPGHGTSLASGALGIFSGVYAWAYLKRASELSKFQQ